MPKILNELTEMIPIGRLTPHPRNANEGDYGAIETSMKANGFFGALVCQKSTGYILCGNHRFLVAELLGYRELPVTWVDVDDDRALRILLADNRTARAGHDNPAKLAELLAEMQNETGTLDGSGYDTDFLDDLLLDLERTAEPVETPAPPPAQEETRPGVIVFCDDVSVQENVFRRLSEMGWDPRKTDVTEKSMTTLAKPKK